MNFSFRIFLLVSAYAYSVSIQSQTIAQFRGTERNGVYNETNLLKTWPITGPELRWMNENIGNGYGSAAVTSDRLYINGEIDSTGFMFVFDLKGNLIWKADYGKEWVVNYNGSRSTPTVVGDLVYVCSGLGNITCFDANNGTKKWSKDMLKDFHGRFTMFGHAESILVDGDKLFLTPGGADTSVVALNRFTGKLVWKCKGTGEIPAYNSPILIQLPTRKILVTFSAYHLLGIDAGTGELLWSHEQVNTPLDKRGPGMGDTHSNSALYENGFIYYVAGDGNCAVKLKLSDDGKQIQQVWRNTELDSYMGGFIKINNRIYAGSESGKNLKCLDAATGQVVDSLKVGEGAIIMADNMLYYYNQKGEMNLVNPGQKLELVCSFKVISGTREHFSQPVIAHGVLYIRHGKSLLAYNIKQK